ncbi:MAG: hypothetical protein ACR2MG_07725 [Pyrinomonadaceae bacterium]
MFESGGKPAAASGISCVVRVAAPAKVIVASPTAAVVPVVVVSLSFPAIPADDGSDFRVGQSAVVKRRLIN